MVWWEAVLSPALQVLFDKLASGEIVELLHKWNINELLIDKLKIAYFTNTAVLDDAEKKQYNNPAIETWLDMLKDVVYEAEDILDELATEALRCKLEASSQSISNQVRNWNFISSSFNPFNEGIESRIEKIINKLEYIAKQKDSLGLKGDGGRSGGITRRVPTTPLLINYSVCGRDQDKEEIIKLLMAIDETSNNEISVIPIIGMGGLGKTTLAQIVFNDERTDDCFDVKAWAFVSDDFDVISITKAILESATSKSWGTMNLELLQDSLKEKLSKKKFLIVLDDVWNENYDNWSDLFIPFIAGAHGSKIIVTTRNEEVLSVMNTLLPYRLKELPDDACWSLFLHHAFGNRNPDAYPSLEAIGRKIVKKCKGLPLAAKTLGGLLGSKLETNHWFDILNSNIWELPYKKSNILPVLRLSYSHLPANLKRCFSYCSIFPKDYEFDKKMLVLLWMAEGLLQQVGESKTMEEVGEEYFGDLLSRSFFQESPCTKSRYVMHDLINELAQFVSRKMCIRVEDKLDNLSEKARHFSYIRGKYDVNKKFEVLYEAQRLRTFFPIISPYGTGFCYLSNKVPHVLLPKLKCLRVLSLSGYCITELPDSIGNLKHLRYLDLSHTAIKCMPESICALYNLQTLMLNDCDSLAELPANMGNLINLRHLDISRSALQKMPLQMGSLRSLRTLPEFIVGIGTGRSAFQKMPGHMDTWSSLLTLPMPLQMGSLRSHLTLPELTVGNGTGSGIGELRDLLHLQGRLTISKLENVVDAWDARRASLTNKQHLEELVMEWSCNFDELRNEMVETTVLEMLQPHQKLERFTMRGYGGVRFPPWLGDPSFSNMVILSCSNCKYCIFLPPLGQLCSLKKLYIKEMTSVQSVGVEFHGDGHSSVMPFPSLEILCFKEMLEWEDWSSSRDGEEIRGFPSLSELYIENCPKLQGKLPNHLPSLTKLVIHESKQLTSPLPRLASVQVLDVKECDELVLRTAVDLTSLVSLHICEISQLTHLPERLIQCLTQLEHLTIVDCFELTSLWRNEVGSQHLISLQRLVIHNCPLLVSLSEEEQQLPRKLKYLEIESCHSLERLPNAWHNLTSLEELAIKECPSLVSLPHTNVPSILRGLAIRGCGLDSLPEAMIHGSNTSLEYLHISGCYFLVSFPSRGMLLPTTFQQLTIDHCPNLESLPWGMMHGNNSSLKALEIYDCSSLTSFPRGQLPSTLKTLTIWSCTMLESLAEVIIQENMSLESFRIANCTHLKSLPNNLYKLNCLDYLEIDGCPGLASFPEGGFPTTSLKKVHIVNCENLKSLPDRMQSLTSLQELRISDCPGIESFPERGLPINLISVEIKDCENISPLSEWGLHRLTYLRKLSINGGCSDLSSFPEWLLPPTLTSLQIGRLVNLESLSSWLQKLTSLEDLKIKECHKLQSLPVQELPATLSRLEISGCPLLKKQCEEDWPKIDHIPCILM